MAGLLDGGIQGSRCKMFFKHKCLNDEDNDDTVNDLTVTGNLDVEGCAHLDTAEIDTLTGIPNGCTNPDAVMLSTHVNTNLNVRDIRTVFLQQISEINLGGGMALLGNVRMGTTGGTTFVREIQRFDNIAGHVPIGFIAVRDIDEYSLGSGLLIRPTTNFVNSINFGNPAGANFQYDRVAFNVTFQGMTGGVPVVGVPNLVLGPMILHRFGNTGGSPMITAVFGTASVIMANAPFDYYESTVAVVPVAFRPTQTFSLWIPGFRTAVPRINLTIIQFLTNGFIRNIPVGAGPAEAPFSDTFIGGDNGLTIGISAATTSYECVTS